MAATTEGVENATVRGIDTMTVETRETTIDGFDGP